MNTKYVIVEQINYGRSWRAKAGLAFETREQGEAWIAAKVIEKYRYRYQVESRKVKDVDASQTMHCQCCTRAIHAALGTIAHHGYQRPGDGWQTASCMGAKRLPWEADRTVVKEVIDHLKEILLRSEYSRMAVSDEIEPVTHHYQVYDRTVKGSYRGKTLEMTRGTFDAIVKANVDNVFKYGVSETYRNTFEQFKARDLHFRDRKIEQLKLDIKEFTTRYTNWKQTHKWNGKLWEAI